MVNVKEIIMEKYEKKVLVKVPSLSSFPTMIEKMMIEPACLIDYCTLIRFQIFAPPWLFISSYSLIYFS